MFEFNKGIKLVAIALVLIILVISSSRLRQIKMNFSTKQLEINFDQANMNVKPPEKNYE